MSSRGRLLSSLLGLAFALVVGQAASATTSHPDYLGPNVSFTSIQETSTFGDPEPLFGAPTGSGDQLLFFPANFTASSAGGGFDQTGAQLQLVLNATGAGAVLETLLIDEFGDNTLLGAGTAATGTFASMAGFLTITHTTAGPISPIVIGFNAGGGVNGFFTPAAVGSTGFALPGDFGVKLWSGHVEIDIASIVPNATRAVLSFDNDLYAYSEVGTSAKIQKKVVDGPAVVITVIPEPGTLALLCGGLLALSIRARGRRA
jgi:hypothetical protein